MGPDDVVVERTDFAATPRDELLIDEPEPIISLEEQGLALADVLGAAGSSAHELAASPIYRDIATTLAADLAELNARPTIGDVPTSLRLPNRPFDARWLTSDKARFELVGAVNRIDRIFVDPKKCGEARLVYRLALRPPDRPETRLPMTINVAFPQLQENGSCVGVAKRWQSFANGTLRTRDVIAFFRALPHFDRIEVNLQNVHGPALRKNEDDHAEYLLRSFAVSNGHATPGPLLDTPKADLDPTLLAKWVTENFAGIDRGTAVLPDAMSATRVVSVTPRGLARPRNRTYSAILEPMKSGLATLPYDQAELAKSYAALVRRLDELACPGCHQSRAVAGFHLLGNERHAGVTFNALEVGSSPHLDGELAWRARLLDRIARGEEFHEARPFAERTSDTGGYGAHCGTGDPAFASWTCDAGLVCRDFQHAEIGICAPDGADGPGDACQSVTITPTDSVDGERITAERSEKCISDTNDPTTSCSPNAFGFPGGLCSDACTTSGVVRGDIICADLPLSGFETDCFPSAKPIEVCQAEHSVRREVRACDRDHPCRDDFGCTRVAGAPSGVGACVPPYFVLQARVDGPARDR